MTKLAGSKPLVLLLEDEALIALNLQDELQDAGYEVAGPFTACAAALEWLQTVTPAMAILDAALTDGSCREIALELTRRRVPFLIYSGYQEDQSPSGRVPACHLDREAGSVCCSGPSLSAASGRLSLNCLGKSAASLELT